MSSTSPGHLGTADFNVSDLSLTLYFFCVKEECSLKHIGICCDSDSGRVAVLDALSWPASGVHLL